MTKLQYVYEKPIRVLLWISAILFVAAMATCHFGVEHEINKIPPEVRAHMSDTDWIGAEWIFGGIGILALSLLSLLAALGHWLTKNIRNRKIHP